MKNIANKKVAVLGWGLDTQDVVPYLLEQKCRITVYDRKAKGELGIMNYESWKIEWCLGSDDFGDLSSYDLIVRNPAVYRFRPEIVAAEEKGAEISSKIKIFFDLCPCPIVGVTGTKGKGTTSTLIYEILKSAGKDVYLGGNIGSGVFDFLPKLTPTSWVVLELSSFQLIDLHKSPHIGVVLMTTVEHQDWHVSPQEYLDAKKPLTQFQAPADFAVINKDYVNSVEIGNQGMGQKIWVSGNNPGVPLEKIRLRGFHNRENVAAAVAVARIVDVPQKVIESTVSVFKGLEHRLEEVRTVNGATYYNDSFSTTPETAMAAIKAFTEPEIIILGGSEKGSDYTDLGQTLVSAKNIKAVILIGVTAEKIEAALKSAAGGKKLGFAIDRGATTMAQIVNWAYNTAVSGDVVVLSPGCASFDMFKNYKDRGEQFKKHVRELGIGN